MESEYKIKKCPRCGSDLDRIVYAGEMFEEWVWNGSTWECLGYSSLIYNPEQNVRCHECDEVVGTGKDFGF